MGIYVENKTVKSRVIGLINIVNANLDSNLDTFLHVAALVRASGMNASELTPFKFGFTRCKFTIIAFYFTRLHGLSELIFIFAMYECR